MNNSSNYPKFIRSPIFIWSAIAFIAFASFAFLTGAIWLFIPSTMFWLLSFWVDRRAKRTLVNQNSNVLSNSAIGKFQQTERTSIVIPYSFLCLVPAFIYYVIEPGVFYDNLVIGSAIFGFAFSGVSRFLTPRNLVSPVIALLFGYLGALIWVNCPTINGYQLFGLAKLTINPLDDLIWVAIIGVDVEFIVFLLVFAVSTNKSMSTAGNAG